MAKKKKTQLKPVARGFATTSVAKKVVPEPEPEESTPETPLARDAAVARPDDNNTVVAFSSDPQEQALQALVEKFQDRVEKDITRTVKTIDQERRFAETLPQIELDGAYVDEVLKLALSETQYNTPLNSPEESQEKLIPRIGVTYGVLRRLGFSEDTVETCLNSISGIDLVEAFDWARVYLVRFYDTKEIKAPTTPRKASPGSSLRPAPLTKVAQLNAFAPAFIPSSPGPSLSSPSTPALTHSEEISGIATPLSNLSDSESSDDDLTTLYVKVKSRIDDITAGREPTESRDIAFLRGLQQRLKDIEQNYLFDAKDAERAYKQQRQKTLAQYLDARLRGSDVSRPVQKPLALKPSKPPSTAPSTAPDTPKHDVFDGSSDDEGGGFLDLLQDMPSTEVTDQGTTITVRDLPLPKHWSGRTPRSLLLDYVHKLDRYAIVEFRSISGHSRAKRAAVKIVWERYHNELSEWVMDDVACHDEIQAEHYISGVALHGLTFPPTAGFAIGSTTVGSTATSFRLLPAVFRDLWGELEEQRKTRDDAINRAIWQKLRSILDAKLTDSKTGHKGGKEASAINDVDQPRSSAQQALTPEQIITSFQALQASQHYREMLQQRNKLPIAAYREQIVKALEENQILVLSGETGCGKSTQLPAFILEHQLSQGKHCKIYCTEPRRISAISLAQRVSQEMGEPPGAVGTLGSIVGYSIRLESNTSRTTRLAYVTNGIALRMLESGSGPGGKGTAFDEITHVIIDEVHERTIESDFMLIVLKSLLKQRSDLKVVLMSATLDADKISDYFDGCPVLQVPGRTFPVEVKYLEDAVELTKWKIDETSQYALRANDKYGRGKRLLDWSEDTTIVEDDEDDDDTTLVNEKINLGKRYSAATASTINLLDERLVPYDLIIRLLEVICLEDSLYQTFSSAVLVFMPGMGEIRRLHEHLTDHPVFSSEGAFRIYPLHSSIASEQQAAVFDIPPPGIRKIVIGHQREMRFDEKRQLSRLVETFVAKSNAKQRRGRAGRVQPGLCFHLFTKSRFDSKLSEHPDPEMMRLSLSDLALRIKIMRVKLGSSIEDVLSRALDPPSSINVQRAVSALIEVGALTSVEDITPMGRLLSKLPTDVHLGKFLLVATVLRCLDPALTVAATLNSKSPFLVPFGKEDEAHRQKLTFKIENSDFLTIHQAFSSWRRACTNGPAVVRKFCRDNFISHQNMQQIEELRQQFLGYLIDSSFIIVDQTESVVRELNRARYSSRGRVRFVTVPPQYDQNSSNIPLINAALAAGLYPKLLSIVTAKDGKDKLVTITNNQAVALHPSSVNCGRKPRDFGVNYLSYFTIMQSKRMYAWETSPVDDLALVLLCGDAEFKLIANTVIVDRKVRFRVHPKSSIALKYLRSHIGTTLAAHFRGDKLGDVQNTWEEMAMLVLGKIKPKSEERRQEHITLVMNRRTG
ncbi:P-loop containing nucleoside triphosphate hydrolase protein [Irpex rosettiformis]|uniref:P-loop containing nucleoside triphosphate hydrolase protein n=1 Tax=Irpex rosettiformis TaxID=378272 RepID=A0ACB8UJJ5_9APHY|nr:P-loop containing nucleoside triphosphate hydrolase protein [Irpex rosettiformis]